MRGDLVARTWSQADGLGRLFPVFALALAIIAAIVDPSSAANVLLAFVPVLAFGVWAFVPKAPLPLVALAVIVPVVIAQRTGALEPIFFDVSILAFVVGRWSPSLLTATALGVVAALSPVVVSVIQSPGEIAVGIWTVGIAFPWALGRAGARVRPSWQRSWRPPDGN